MRWFAFCLIVVVGAGLGFGQSTGDLLVINGKALDDDEMKIIHRLEQQFGAKAVPGRYWYDALSGLYGPEGYGAIGQMPPKLELGGKLREDASKGDTGIWVNGRQLNRTDVAYLLQCTPVLLPGRFWMDALGNSGVEGGPAQWNLAALCAAARQRAGGSFSGQYGSVLSDGETTGAIFRTPGGGVTGVTCGPDGGCIY